MILHTLRALNDLYQIENYLEPLNPAVLTNDWHLYAVAVVIIPIAGNVGKF